MFFPFFPLVYPVISPIFTPIDDRPPTLYRIMNSMVNYDIPEEDQVRIKNLAESTHARIFNFTYPLSTKVSKHDFEIMILNHFIMRRIGYQTFTAFQIALENKLNEIMPMYNKMFDVLDEWNIYNDGVKQTRISSDEHLRHDTENIINSNTTTSSGNDTHTNDRRYSDTPQNKLSEVQSGEYVSEYEYNQDTNTSQVNGHGDSSSDTVKDGSENINYTETVERSPHDKIDILIRYQKQINSIYTLLFKDLDNLFYGLE